MVFDPFYGGEVLSAHYNQYCTGKFFPMNLGLQKFHNYQSVLLFWYTKQVVQSSIYIH